MDVGEQIRGENRVGLDHVSVEMPTDFKVDMLVGNQEEKASAVQGRSPSWR